LKAFKLRTYEGIVYDPSAPPSTLKIPSTAAEINRRKRQLAYSRPLSVFDSSMPSIPLHAKPLETFIKPPGFNAPSVSKGLLTPTEAASVQADNNLLTKHSLGRIIVCPYLGCNKYFLTTDVNMIQEHLVKTHEAETCNFCDDPLYKWWPKEERHKHYLTKHPQLFKAEDAAALAQPVEITSLDRVHFREKKWRFCARCSRNHELLSHENDRSRHDNVCFVGMRDEPTRPEGPFCTQCGHEMKGPAHMCGISQKLKDEYRSCCPTCGYPLGGLSPHYHDLHLSECKGVGCRRRGDDPAAFCCWCGVELPDKPAEKQDHLNRCACNPYDYEGPLDPYTGEVLGIKDRSLPLAAQGAQMSKIAGVILGPPELDQAPPGDSSNTTAQNAVRVDDKLEAIIKRLDSLEKKLPEGSANPSPKTNAKRSPKWWEGAENVLITSAFQPYKDDNGKDLVPNSPPKAAPRSVKVSKAQATLKLTGRLNARRGQTPKDDDPGFNLEDGPADSDSPPRGRRGGTPVDASYRPKPGEGMYEDDADEELEKSAVGEMKKEEEEEEEEPKEKGKGKRKAAAPRVPPKPAKMARLGDEPDADKKKPPAKTPRKASRAAMKGSDAVASTPATTRKSSRAKTPAAK
jgi:hypothetical protein